MWQTSLASGQRQRRCRAAQFPGTSGLGGWGQPWRVKFLRLAFVWIWDIPGTFGNFRVEHNKIMKHHKWVDYSGFTGLPLPKSSEKPIFANSTHLHTSLRSPSRVLGLSLPPLWAVARLRPVYVSFLSVVTPCNSKGHPSKTISRQEKQIGNSMSIFWVCHITSDMFTCFDMHGIWDWPWICLCWFCRATRRAVSILFRVQLPVLNSAAMCLITVYRQY